MTGTLWRKASRLSFIALFLTLLAMTGCKTAMSSSHFNDDDGSIVRNTFPLKFREHNFGAYCFNTIGCKVLYAGHYAKHKADDEVSPPPPPNYLKNISGSRGGVENFPPPAVVTWRSLDGMAHEAKVDIGAIFGDERVLHQVPESDIPEITAAFSGPDIIIVVNDRTISVYMKTIIYLKQLRIPSNPYSNSIEQTTLAYNHTY